MTADTIAVSVQTLDKSFRSSRSDSLAIEEPLQFCLNGSPLSITMRTPGSDLDLAVGFLFTEGIIDDVSQILSMRAESPADDPEQSGDKVTIRLRPDIAIDPARIRRNFYTSSSRGVCGKLAIGAIEVRPSRLMRQSGPQFRADLIYRLPALLRQAQDNFDRTGGIHAAALFSPEGDLLGLREDVGRHNAVDKLIGFALRDGSIPPELQVALPTRLSVEQRKAIAIAAGSLDEITCTTIHGFCQQPVHHPVWPWSSRNVLA